MPEFFPDLYGNRATCQRLGQALLSGNLPHAILIEGGSGSGKLTLAKGLAQGLFCTSAHAFPCGTCPTCRKIKEGLSPDVTVISKGERATIGIAEIRAIREDMHLSPIELSCKVYIIRDAQVITPEGQNALLISLEEPPKNVYIFLLAESSDTILTTVKSRVQPIRMECFDRHELAAYAREHLKEAPVRERESPEEYALALTAARGRIGALRAMLDRKKLTALAKTHETVDSIMTALLQKKDFSSLYDSLSCLPAKRPELLSYLLLLSDALRDLIVVRRGDRSTTLYYPDAEKAQENAEKKSLRYLISCYDIFTNAAQDCAGNGNLALITASLVSQLRTL